MISFDTFKKGFALVSEEMELRRKHFLRSFYIGALASALLFGICFLFLTPFLSLFLSDEQLRAAQEGDGFLLLRVYALLSIGFLLLRPIFRYRGTNRTAALVTFSSHRFSLKDYTYSKLLSLFGAFEFAPRGGISLVETRNSTLFPEYQLYLSEDLVVGQMHSITTKFCEANIVQVVDRKRVSAFRGLLFVCDISETSLKLRAHFQGRTVVVHDAKKHLDTLASKYQNMSRFDLPEAFEPVLEGYTTNAAEAAQVITAELLLSIQKLALLVNGLTHQVEHFDSKLAHAGEELYEYGKNQLLERVRTKLPSEQDYDDIHATGLDITKSDPLSQDALSLNQHFELEFYDDKFIITIPCAHDLFETDSLFSPALNDEDAVLLYSIMLMLDTVTGHLAGVKA